MRLRHQFNRRVAAGQHSRRCAQVFGQFEDRQCGVALRHLQALQLRRFHIGGMPAHTELAGQPRCGAHSLFSALAFADAGQDGAFGVPDRGNGFFHPVASYIVFNVFRRAPERNLAQSNQIALAEEIFGGAFGLLRQVDLASFQARHQLIRGDIDQNDFVRIVQHRVRHGFVDPNARDRAHRAVQTLQVLHIQGRPDIYAGFQQLEYILPAFRVTRALHVAVRQLIDQQYTGLARQRRIKVKLLQRAAPVGDVFQRQLLEPGNQLCGLAAAMGFNHPHRHVTAGLALALRRTEHRVSLANASAGTKINTQPAAPRAGFFTTKLLEQLVRVRA